MPTETQLNSSINGKSITIDPNNKLILKLDVHADGGYNWVCQVSDTNVIKKDSTHFAPKNGGGNMVGGMSLETFFFSNNKSSGKCNITLIEQRSWEKNIPPINTVQFHVLVK